MSAKVMGRVWDLKLPQNQLIVLLAMADHADHEGGSIFPGTPLIAWKAGLSEKQTQRIIKGLVASGILVEQSAKPGQKKVYRIDFSKATFKTPLIRKTKRATPPIAMSTPIAMSSLDMPSEELGHSTPDMPSLKSDDEPSVFKPSVTDAHETPIPTATEQDLIDGFNDALKAKATGAIVLEGLTPQNRKVAQTLIGQGQTRESIRRYTEHRLFGRREKYKFAYIPADLMQYPMPEVYTPESNYVQPPDDWMQPKPPKTPEELAEIQRIQEENAPELTRYRRRMAEAKKRNGAA